mgnify:CR=1 FL=1|jgi:hypothetical protein
MNIDLTSEEVQIIRDLVERRIAELGPEIHHTSRRAYRDALEALREQLMSMLSRLSPAA